MSQTEAGPATDGTDGGAEAVDFSQDDVEVLQKRKQEFDQHVAETAELTKRHYEAPILLSKEQQSILETKKVGACCSVNSAAPCCGDRAQSALIGKLVSSNLFPHLLRWNEPDEFEDGERKILSAAR